MIPQAIKEILIETAKENPDLFQKQFWQVYKELRQGLPDDESVASLLWELKLYEMETMGVKNE